ncbi:BZ3500_MvSof-1268-A1-R1_Chr11-2g03393 [Microbotryum saponariae]|uniref:Delta(14)-sterol reductase n=1 Tax=Microbotryum saponariae TaxID=289078 RepID=A0A2X0MTB2_9BASI|nr:BZ3500_MvSof-1268-A1-R1_Chr11-2g03393 [Microbotryum saponariae]SDA03277.1 BZ3501_MvSof-1269-A2-R1_Chr11g02964 [Microbotryum saponariae]
MVATRSSSAASTPNKAAATSSPKPQSSASSSATGYEPAPRSTSYEFGGPIGALGVTVAVPFFAYWLTLACTAQQCPPWPMSHFLDFHGQRFQRMTTLHFYRDLFSKEASIAYALWYLWTVVCWAVLPGDQVQGVELRDGSRLTYTMNAFATMVLTLVLIATVTYTQGLKPLLFIVENYVQLISAAILMSVAQALFVHVQSHQKEVSETLGAPRGYLQQPMLALGGNTDSGLYNWFIGRGLNPRIGSFDIKSFNELRPGMILWIIIDLAMIAYQYHTIGRVTDSILLVVAFHSWYVFDALYNEAAILTTMDITTDGFGFMLSVGDLLWVPFTYSTSARYLALHPNDLGPVKTVLIIALQFLGYWIFRSSNSEKNEFRKGNNPKSECTSPVGSFVQKTDAMRSVVVCAPDLKFLQTERGTKLLTSGWWGLSRHPNYMGDWFMSWAWSLPTGFSSPVPYYYVIFFAILLIHRGMRDDEACAHKYKKDWETYKGIVKWRIIPYVY